VSLWVLISRSLFVYSSITHSCFHLHVSKDLLVCFRLFSSWIPCTMYHLVMCFMNLLPCTISPTFGIFNHGMKWGVCSTIFFGHRSAGTASVPFNLCCIVFENGVKVSYIKNWRTKGSSVTLSAESWGACADSSMVCELQDKNTLTF
jgi:hypothetical protein